MKFQLVTYVLTGGELAAMVVIDAVVRLFQVFLAMKNRQKQDSFSTGLLEHPHYTDQQTSVG